MKVCELKEGYIYEDNSKRGWCKNGVFRINKLDDGRIRVVDTYWSDNNNGVIATDEYVKDFKELFLLDDVVMIGKYDYKFYNDEDLIYARYTQMSNTGFSNTFIRKETKRNKDLVREVLLDRIKSKEYDLESAKRELVRFDNGELDAKHIYA